LNKNTNNFDTKKENNYFFITLFLFIFVIRFNILTINDMTEEQSAKLSLYDEVFKRNAHRVMHNYDHEQFKKTYSTLYFVIISSMKDIELLSKPKRKNDIPTSETTNNDYREIDNANII
jgi:hypothetical protein